MRPFKLISPAGILFFITAVFCFPIIFSRGVVGNYGDIYQYAWPFRHFAKETLQTGTLPLWNPYIFAGTPFSASPQSALFYPLTTFFYFLPMNYAFNFFTLFHVFLNAFGTFLLLRLTGRSRSASLFGASLWAFSFFFLSKIAAGHVIHLSGYSWTPFVLLFLASALSAIGSSNSSASPTGLKQNSLSPVFFLFSISFLIQFLSGHTQVWFHTSIFILLVFLWKMAATEENERTHYFSFAFTALACFIGFSFIQSLPTFIYTFYSTRFNPTEIFTPQSAYDIASSYSMNWNALIGLLLPDFFGSPMKNNYIFQATPSAYFETNAIYFGIIPLILSITGLVMALKKRKFLLPALCLLFLILAMGKNSFIYAWIWKALGFLRAPARFYFLLFITLLLSASFAWDKLFKGKAAGLKIILLSAVLLDLFIHGKPFIWPEPYLQKVGKSSATEWLQPRLARMKNDASRSALTPYRIFTAEEAGNHNKSMLFHFLNINGYEAILQKSFLTYFAATQGSPYILTTGADIGNPDKTSFQFFSDKYIVSARELSPKWPVKFRQSQMNIYENPEILFPARPFFSLRNMPDTKTLIQFMDSKNFTPSAQILKVEPQLTRPGQFSTAEKEKLAMGVEENLPPRPVQLNSFQRVSPNKITMGWASPEKLTLWIFLSEAFYPGWEVWSQSGLKMIPFQSNGYFQAVQFPKTESPHEKIFWLYRPKDFIAGAFISMLSLSSACMALFVFLKNFIRR